MKSKHDISKYGVPNDLVSCPGCGDNYGTYNRKICIKCEECSKCCSCEIPKFVNCKEGIEEILRNL